MTLCLWLCPDTGPARSPEALAAWLSAALEMFARKHGRPAELLYCHPRDGPALRAVAGPRVRVEESSTQAGTVWLA